MAKFKEPVFQKMLEIVFETQDIEKILNNVETRKKIVSRIAAHVYIDFPKDSTGKTARVRTFIHVLRRLFMRDGHWIEVYQYALFGKLLKQH